MGATAGFRNLLDEVSTPGFLRALAEQGYSRLDVQCGPDLAHFRARVAALAEEDRRGIEVSAFSLVDDITPFLVACRGEEGVRLAGCVISHAGKQFVFRRLSTKHDENAWLMTFRHRYRFGGPASRRAAGRCHQSDANGQPSAGVGRGPCTQEARYPRSHRVSSAVFDQMFCANQYSHLDDALVEIAQLVNEGMLDRLPPYAPPTLPVPPENRITFFDWMVLTCYPDELRKQRHLAALCQAAGRIAAPRCRGEEDDAARMQVE